MAVALSVVAIGESSGSVTSFSQAATLVVGKKYLVHVMTEGPAVTAMTANGTSITGGLVDAWTNTGTSNPRTYVYLYTAVATSTTFQVTGASASKQGIQVVLVDDLLSVRSSTNVGAVSGSLSASLTSAPGDRCAVFLSSWYALGTITPGSGVSALSGTSGRSNIELYAAEKAGGSGTITMGATFTSGQWSAVMVSLQPATTVPAPTNGTVGASVSGDQITVSCTITSNEAPAATANLGGAATLSQAMTVTGSAPTYSATATFTGLANGTYTTSVTSGNSGGSDTDSGPSKAVDMVLIDAGSFPIMAGVFTTAASPATLNMIKGETRKVTITVLDEFGLPRSGVTPAIESVMPGYATIGTIAATNGDGQTQVNITANVAGTILVSVAA